MDYTVMFNIGNILVLKLGGGFNSVCVIKLYLVIYIYYLCNYIPKYYI